MKKLIVIISLLFVGSFGVQSIVAQSGAPTKEVFLEYVSPDDPAHEKWRYFWIPFPLEMVYSFEYLGFDSNNNPEISLEIRGDTGDGNYWGSNRRTYSPASFVIKDFNRVYLPRGSYFVIIREEKGWPRNLLYGKFTIEQLYPRSTDIVTVGRENSFILTR